MINKNEIRIGNWIEVVAKMGNYPMKITKERLLMVIEHPDGFNPIKLCPEILIGIGFQEDTEFPLMSIAKRYFLKIKLFGSNPDNNNDYEFGFIHQIKIDDLFGEFTVNGAYASPRIEFVHQLQNAYYDLTREEFDLLIVYENIG